MTEGQARTRNKSAASLLARTAAEPLRDVLADAADKGVINDVVLGAAAFPAKTVNNIQVGTAKTPPRRAMYDTTADATPGSGKISTDVPADAAEEGATNDVALGVDKVQCCHGKN